MLHFTVDDPQAPVNGCHTCCCEKLALQPGTTSKVTVGYASWAVPIGQLHCGPQFMLEQMETCPVPAGGSPIATSQPHFDVVLNTELDGDLTTFIEDPEDDPLVFKLLPLYGPKYGQLSVEPSGAFSYLPAQDYGGADRFFVSVTDGITPPAIFEVLLGIDTPSADVKPTPHVSIDQAGVSTDQRWYTISFPIKVSPAAQLCEIWRLTVLQAALDCDCTCYSRTDCFDIGIAKC
ncbi:Ig-like domain-containing protein [Bradyrhizobium elkanii]|uniref:Ig-like domain-containing protein n=1 Tax=Bradyrhizobium elkanii TaxID=29448 RepID=UPI0004B8D5A6|nr:Ig-like domain-containing protein [Bradyrhizobium elkanii]WLA79582.1 Ig-like domain-containing protein [Bradyrhizobium elkanii]